MNVSPQPTNQEPEASAGPAPGDGALLTEEELRSFRELGYVAIKRPLVPPSEVAEVRGLLDALYARAGELPPAHLHDLAESSAGGKVNPEIIDTVHLDARLLDSAAYRRCQRIAEQLLGRRAEIDFDHAIFKPPHTGSATAWHQDLAFNEGADRAYATIWLALVDATEENGCMRYIAGSPPLMPHERVGRDGLRVVDLDEAGAVACPVPAGGMTIHNQHTLHTSGPNDSDGVRAAWILKYDVPDDRQRRGVLQRGRELARSALSRITGHGGTGPDEQAQERPAWAESHRE